MKTVGIIGGGASGLTAAIAAASEKTVRVFILEHQDKAGRKLLSTGNGRCNLTNENMSPSFFRSREPEAVRRVLERFGYEETIRFFQRMGLMTKSRNGYVYPRSGQASTVLQTLRQEAERLGVQIHTGVHVTEIRPEKGRFSIRSEEKTYSADRVILSAGGKAAPALGSDGSGYALAKLLGHTLVPVTPALVQLRTQPCPLAKAAGVRVDAGVKILVNGKHAAEDKGEILLTAYGISGIPVFQVSRYASGALREKKKVQAELDLLLDISEEEFFRYLICQKKERGGLPAAAYLSGVFPEKLVLCLLSLSGIPFRKKAREIPGEALRRLSHQCKRLMLQIEADNGFDNAQVCAGGVSLKEIDCRTMQSRLVKGAYLTGELLDADGICGGYNLQWAWATGYLAGKAAAQMKEVRR